MITLEYRWFLFSSFVFSVIGTETIPDWIFQHGQWIEAGDLPLTSLTFWLLLPCGSIFLAFVSPWRLWGLELSISRSDYICASLRVDICTWRQSYFDAPTTHGQNPC